MTAFAAMGLPSRTSAASFDFGPDRRRHQRRVRATAQAAVGGAEVVGLSQNHRALFAPAAPLGLAVLLAPQACAL